MRSRTGFWERTEQGKMTAMMHAAKIHPLKMHRTKTKPVKLHPAEVFQLSLLRILPLLPKDVRSSYRIPKSVPERRSRRSHIRRTRFSPQWNGQEAVRRRMKQNAKAWALPQQEPGSSRSWSGSDFWRGRAATRPNIWFLPTKESHSSP